MATISSLQKLLPKEDCEKILRRSLDSPVQFSSYKIAKFSEGVAGYLGEHLSLTIKYTRNKIASQISFFMKTVPQFNPSQLKYVTEAGIFKKEVLLYQNLLSELLKISKFGPKCYFVRDNLIVLEDLRARGFKMLPKHLHLDEDHCYSTLKTLAGYHAATIIYEERRGLKLDEKFKEEIKEACFNFIEGQPRQKWLVSGVRCVTDLMRLVGFKNYDADKICDKFRKFVFGDLPLLLSPATQFRNVLTHDDLWCNNLLYNDKNECVFVDFQLVRYAPPGLDFLVTLYLNLDCFHVDNNLSHYVDIYYSHFVEALERNHLESKVLPRSEFEETLDYYKLTALTENALYGTHIYISDELSNQIVGDFDNYNEFSFINRSKFAVKEFKDNPEYRDRISTALSLLIETLDTKIDSCQI